MNTPDTKYITVSSGYEAQSPSARMVGVTNAERLCNYTRLLIREITP